MNRLPTIGLSVLALATAASTARATYSIAAVDTESRQVGGAVTSCVGNIDLSMVYASLPGVGVIHAQSLFDDDHRLRTRAIDRMQEGREPADILAELTQPLFDPQVTWRQYGIVEMNGEPMGFTGDDAYVFKGTQHDSIPGFRYSVQGNYLTGEEVLTQTAKAFAAGGCDLAERLMLAIEAGAQHGGGDDRCKERNIPSDSAFIQVDLPDEPAGSYLNISVTGTGSQNPLILLREQFNAWRATHPCQ